MCASKSGEKAVGRLSSHFRESKRFRVTVDKIVDVKIKGKVNVGFDASSVTFVWNLHSILSRTVSVLLQDGIRPPTPSCSSSLLRATCAVLSFFLCFSDRAS